MGNLFSSAPKEQKTSQKTYPRDTSGQPSYRYDVEDNIFRKVESRKPVEERPYPRIASTSGYRCDYDNNRTVESSSYYRTPQGQSLTYSSSNGRTTHYNEILQRQVDLDTNFNRMQKTQVTPCIKVQKNPTVLNLSSDIYFNSLQVVTDIPLLQTDPEYLKIKKMISNKRNFIIDSVEKIENPYLKKAYELKKEQKLQQDVYFEERLLFHGTKHENVESICKFNFNWRLVKAHKFGMGVSFSPNSTYASNYSDKYLYNKVMIVAKVLVGYTCPGHQFMVLPEEGCDASTKGEDDVVIVKYEDNEFCPVYKINYHLVNPNVGKRRNHNQKMNYSY